MKSKPKILIHEGGTGHGIKVAQCLAKTGDFQVEIAAESAHSASRFSRYVTRFHLLRAPANSPDGISQIKDIIRQRKIDVLLPINPGEIAAVMEEGFDLRSLVRIPLQPSTKAYDRAGNKENLSFFLEQYGLPHPRTIRYETDRGNFQTSLETLRFPVLAKPTSSGGGTGIRLIDTPEILISFLEANSNPDNPYIVQEFIQGRDYGCGVWCVDGEIQYHTIYKRSQSDGNSLEPFRGLIFVDHDPVITIAKKLMKELRWNGIAQIDLRVDEATGEVFVIEVNPRFWATIVGSMRMGINFPELACRQALEHSLSPLKQKPGRYVTRSGSISYVKQMLLNQNREQFPGLKNNGLFEAISDPLPVIFELGSRIKRKRFRKDS